MPTEFLGLPPSEWVVWIAIITAIVGGTRQYIKYQAAKATQIEAKTLQLNLRENSEATGRMAGKVHNLEITVASLDEAVKNGLTDQMKEVKDELSQIRQHLLGGG